MPSMSPPQGARVLIRYEIPRTRSDWTLPEEPVPESQPHDQTIDLLKAILKAWVQRMGRNALVARNLAVRWDLKQPQIGFDPDLCVVEPRAPEADELESLCTWREGHHPPRLAIEVVSSKPRKDYHSTPEKCAAAGVEELWVFDPTLSGPRTGGGPYRLQVWRRDGDHFQRVFAGDGPAYSPYLDAYAVPVQEGRRLRITDDREGERWWLTAEENERAAKENERAAKESERAAKESERAAKEAALARIAELEAKLKA
jgi:Uma2 family endonuclease